MPVLLTELEDNKYRTTLRVVSNSEGRSTKAFARILNHNSKEIGIRKVFGASVIESYP